MLYYLRYSRWTKGINKAHHSLILEDPISKITHYKYKYYKKQYYTRNRAFDNWIRFE